MIEYVNGPRSNNSYALHLKADLYYIEDEHYYFIFQKFYEELKRGDWTQRKSIEQLTMIRQHFKGDFDCQEKIS